MASALTPRGNDDLGELLDDDHDDSQKEWDGIVGPGHGNPAVHPPGSTIGRRNIDATLDRLRWETL